MPNFSSLAGLEVAEKFLWVGGGGGVVCTVIFMSNPTVVLCCVGVGVLTVLFTITSPFASAHTGDCLPLITLVTSEVSELEPE